MEKTRPDEIHRNGFELIIIAPALHHYFTDIVRELNRILNWQAFNQERLIVEQIGEQIQLRFIVCISVLQRLEYLMLYVDFEHFFCFNFLTARHCV
ncbi:hypothetical protein D1872_255030 [compost metagenome]